MNSWREGANDHYVYFGSSSMMNGKVVNDVVCQPSEGFGDQ